MEWLGLLLSVFWAETNTTLLTQHKDLIKNITYIKRDNN